MDVNLALQLLLALIAQADKIGAALRKAKEEGREDLTEEEVRGFAGQDDAARERLKRLIDSIPND